MQLSSGSRKRLTLRKNPAHGAVGLNDPVFALVIAKFGCAPFERLNGFRAIFGCDQFFPVGERNLLTALRQTEDLAGQGRNLHCLALPVDAPQAQCRRANRNTKTLFALAQGLFGALPFADVDHQLASPFGHLTLQIERDSPRVFLGNPALGDVAYHGHNVPRVAGFNVLEAHLKAEMLRPALVTHQRISFESVEVTRNHS